MRQAGRYLPEYRKLRSGVSFLEMCRDVERAVAATLQPIDLLGVEAAILFSDIFVPVTGMGVELDFRPGPVVAHPVRSLDAIRALRVPDPVESVPYVFEILRRLREELASREIPLLGFAGAPFTLAAYLVEGSGSKSFSVMKRMLYSEPRLLSELLELLTEMTVGYLRAQVDAGAEAVQLFDTWAGLLDREAYRRFVLPTHESIAKRLDRPEAPLVLYVNDGAHVLDLMVESGADMLSIDWRCEMGEAARLAGRRASLQGNLDPCALAAPPDEIERRVRAIAAAARPARGHVLNLGHGCLPDTPVEGVRAFVAAAKRLGEPS
ncbi:uroporphyrinogen decarboxylase [Myxococcaceae bacterium]|jgi:uroporphyrinogen decarboxylase|nr:uroporphyrinogen decarboxylase [Myxococcaceae bacterium]